MMTEVSYVKMSACRNLSHLLGEPNREENKKDLEYWNSFFDRRFQERWGIDPRSGLVDPTKWVKIGADESVPSVYQHTLDWACNQNRRAGRCTHLGLQGGRACSPVLDRPVDGAKVEPTPHTPVSESSASDGQLTPILESEDSAELARSQCSSPTPRGNSELKPPSPFQSSPPCSPSPSRKRKQATIDDFFTQKKRMRTAKRRIDLK